MTNERATERTFNVVVTPGQAKLLFELVTRAAAGGPDAANLAALYASVKAADAYLNPASKE